MAKRKRDLEARNLTTSRNAGADVSKVVKTNGHLDVKTIVPNIQIVTGSYERVLHGITASISNLSSSEPSTSPSVQFADTFLFNAHASAIRCLALSPLPDSSTASSQGVYLATGGSDERINVYSLAAFPAIENDKIPAMPTLGNQKISENPRNRELGTMAHHSSNVTALHFPTRSKLLSASEDNTIVIARTKDLNVVSTVKAPNPKALGQPSGDTAPLGITPAGINDFAVHPSLKLMLSVGRGEKCMRLWNLVTGRKAGVLNFNRDMLQSVKESKYSSGEARRIRWTPDGTEFAVAFERGVVMFGEDSKARCKALPVPLTKVHQICYVSVPDGSGNAKTILAVSTEDGRVVFYDTDQTQNHTSTGNTQSNGGDSVPDAQVVSQLGGKEAGVSSRIKDFEILFLGPEHSGSGDSNLVVVTANSDGAIRVWLVPTKNLAKAGKSDQVMQIGTLMGTYETGNRITCLKAFVMLPSEYGEEGGMSEFEGLTEDGEDESSESDDG